MKLMETPRELGFRMPAEWEPQEAVWLTWPVNETTWPGLFERIPPKFAEIASLITRHESVHINCPRPVQASARKHLRAAGAVLERVRFFDHPSNDAWCRDHGPIFVKNDSTGQVALTDWKYNAWGGKYPPYDADDAIPLRIAEALEMMRFDVPAVMEGGSLEVDGRGALLTTTSCLGNPNRNPHLSPTEIERLLSDHLGVDRVYWLDEGIAGDDTDGHIDDIARFLPGGGIACVAPENESDIDFRPMRLNLERLESFRDAAGNPFEIVSLPAPEPVYFRDDRLPASYANYLVINDAVLLPTFGQPRPDGLAREILAGCFPGRVVYPVDCVDLVVGLGTLHCISQQQPLGSL